MIRPIRWRSPAGFLAGLLAALLVSACAKVPDEFQGTWNCASSDPREPATSTIEIGPGYVVRRGSDLMRGAYTKRLDVASVSDAGRGLTAIHLKPAETTAGMMEDLVVRRVGDLLEFPFWGVGPRLCRRIA